MYKFSKEEMMSDEEFEAFRKRVFGEDLGRKKETDKAFDKPHGFSVFSVSLDQKGTLWVTSRKRTPDGTRSCGSYSVRPGDEGYEASVKYYDRLGLARGKNYFKQERWENGEWLVEREDLSDTDLD
ncbi:MAG: hypothetical protein C5B53_02350 [Candidatus Melainabacteria bacterium]|nr:MAG: hypothetical protein C5B53_02350 [Candidatus Melainabacteria bacterium]